MNAHAFGMANGLAYAVFMAGLAWFAALFHVGDNAVRLTAEYYPGYRANFSGGVLGALYGFASGYAIGWVTAALYNASRSGRLLPVPAEPPIPVR